MPKRFSLRLRSCLVEATLPSNMSQTPEIIRQTMAQTTFPSKAQRMPENPDSIPI